MTDLRIADVSFAYPQQSTLLKNINVTFSMGWAGVVGANGTGKSTLLKLLNGSLKPESGEVHLTGRHVTYQRQTLLSQESVAPFAREWSKESLRWLSLFDVEPESFEKWETLSAGERRRWQLAMAFRSAKDVLILDEPTNHLDSDGRNVLLEAMRCFDGVGIVVSHDRTLLNRITTRTVRVSPHGVRSYPCAYSDARRLWDAEAAGELQALNRAQDDLRTMQAQLRQVAARHESSKRGLSTKKRMKSIRDTDASGMLAKGRAEFAEARIGQSRGVLHRAVARAKDELSGLPRPEELGEIFWETVVTHRKTLARLDNGFEVYSDSRVWLRGPNGGGKTTFIRKMLESLLIADEHIVYVPQEPQRKPIFEAARQHHGDEKSKMLHAASALGLDVQIFLNDLPASEGQLKKLAIAEGLVRKPMLIVLDEPTNDLDIDGIERLERALQGFPGALVLVTHDDMLANTLGLEPIDVQINSD